MTDTNPFAYEVYACHRCKDHRYVNRGRAEVKCPDCEGWDPVHRAEMLRLARRDGLPKPTLTVDDMSPETKARFRRLCLDNPDVSPVTVLTWVEGERYDPEKDPDFQRECLKELRKWRFETNRPEPETTLDIPTPTPML